MQKGHLETKINRDKKDSKAVVQPKLNVDESRIQLDRTAQDLHPKVKTTRKRQKRYS